MKFADFIRLVFDTFGRMSTGNLLLHSLDQLQIETLADWTESGLTVWPVPMQP